MIANCPNIWNDTKEWRKELAEAMVIMDLEKAETGIARGGGRKVLFWMETS